jgi:hypothetical protein
MPLWGWLIQLLYAYMNALFAGIARRRWIIFARTAAASLLGGQERLLLDDERCFAGLDSVLQAGFQAFGR